jgi:hypothetical protein
MEIVFSVRYELNFCVVLCQFHAVKRCVADRSQMARNTPISIARTVQHALRYDKQLLCASTVALRVTSQLTMTQAIVLYPNFRAFCSSPEL